MIGYSVKADVKQVVRELDRVSHRAVPRATVTAINRTITGLRTDTRRMLSKDVGVKQKDIKQDFTVRKATSSKMAGYLVGKGRVIALSKFRVRQTKRGVSARLPGRARQDIQGAFIATMPSGHRGVFMRAGKRRGPARRVKSGSNVGKSYRPQLGINELFVTSVPSEMRKKKVIRNLDAFASKRFGVEIRRALRKHIETRQP